MVALSPSLLIAAANAFVGLGGDADNRSPVVDLFLREVRQPSGQPWCAAFVHHVGFWSHYDNTTGKSSWPLPPTAACKELGEFARRRDVLMVEPDVGDIFLIFSHTLRRFAHTGIIVSLESYDETSDGVIHECLTVEGNTNPIGSRTGHKTLGRRRRFSIAHGDRFIRWTRLAIPALRAAA